MPVLSLRPQLGAAPAVEQALPYVFVELDLGNLVSGAILDDPLTAQLEGSPFAPTDITGLTAWYDFSDITTLWQDTARTSAITADGQAIKGVTDKSGAAKHLSEGTFSPSYKTAIIGGKSVVRFVRASDHRLVASGLIQSTTAFSLFAVVKATGSAGTYRTPVFIGTSVSTNGYGLQATAANNRGMVSRGIAVLEDAATTANAELWSAVRPSGGPVVFYLNGVSQSITNSTSTPVVPTLASVVGSQAATSENVWDGEIGEVICFNVDLSSTDRDAITSYLMTKWGL